MSCSFPSIVSASCNTHLLYLNIKMSSSSHQRLAQTEANLKSINKPSINVIKLLMMGYNCWNNVLLEKDRGYV